MVLATRRHDEALHNDEAHDVATPRIDEATLHEALLHVEATLHEVAQHVDATLHDEALHSDEALVVAALHSVCSPSGRTSALGGYGSGRAQQNVYTRI